MSSRFASQFSSVIRSPPAVFFGRNFSLVFASPFSSGIQSPPAVFFGQNFSLVRASVFFGHSVATGNFLRCKFRNFSLLFSSVIRSPPPIFFGANIASDLIETLSFFVSRRRPEWLRLAPGSIFITILLDIELRWAGLS